MCIYTKEAYAFLSQQKTEETFSCLISSTYDSKSNRYSHLWIFEILVLRSENCLTLDIYTSSVVYNDLQPVVVYIDGDDLSQEEEEALQPSASLAHDHKTVFVSVNYRYILFSHSFA